MKEWYELRATAAEQEQFNTNSSFRASLVNRLYEQIHTRAQFVSDIAHRIAPMVSI